MSERFVNCRAEIVGDNIIVKMDANAKSVIVVDACAAMIRQLARIIDEITREASYIKGQNDA